MMKPSDRRGAWKAEPALKRLRKCLGFMRAGNFISPGEHERILKRVAKWKAKKVLRTMVVSNGEDGRQIIKRLMRDTIQQRFQAFHDANPGVYACLVKLTQERFLKGTERHGLKALWEQLRYRIATGNITLAEGYNFNNDFTSRYARLLVREYPAYRGLFELRRLRAD